MDYKIAYKGENVHNLTIPLDTLCFILQRKDDDTYCDEYIAVSNRSFTISLERLSVCDTTVSRLRKLAIAIRRCKGDEAESMGCKSHASYYIYACIIDSSLRP